MSNSNVSSEDFTEHGFARFCSLTEYENIDQGLQREFELPDVSAPTRTVKVFIPKKDLVILSVDSNPKLINHHRFRIKSAEEHVGPVYLLSQRAGWNQNEDDLRLLASHKRTINLLGVFDFDSSLDPLGSGMVVEIGKSVCWIGMILVHPELRRQGIAGAIMEQCIELARLKMQQIVIGLDATPAGKKVYQNIGFEPSFALWRSKLSTDTDKVNNESLEIVASTSVEGLSAFLREVNLEQNVSWLKLILQLNPGGLWVARSNGKILGLVMSRPGRLLPFVGPLIATSHAAARSLLHHALSHWKEMGLSEVFIDIPENHFRHASLWENETDCISPPTDCVLSNEIQPVRSLVRMYELITDKNYTQLSVRNTKHNRYLRSKKVLDHGRKACHITIDYMKEEKEALRYIFATGGPEVS